MKGTSNSKTVRQSGEAPRENLFTQKSERNINKNRRRENQTSRALDSPLLRAKSNPQKKIQTKMEKEFHKEMKLGFGKGRFSPNF